MNTCCKEWALKVAPRQSQHGSQVSFEEEHTCPSCQERYLIWFTSIGKAHTRSAQIVPVTIKPAQDIVQSSGYMQHCENGLGGATWTQGRS